MILIDNEKIFFKIRAKHGEGIILRDPSAPYDPGYSHFMYKHKVEINLYNIILYLISLINFLLIFN